MNAFSRAECIIFAVLSSSLSSVATLFKAQGVSLVPPVLAAAGGLLIASGVSWIYLALRGRMPTLSAIKKVRAPLCKLILCRPVVANLLFSIGLSMTAGIKAVFLTKMEPYLVIFWVWILDGKRPSPRHLLLLVIHIAGAVMLSVGDLKGASTMEWGDLIIVGAVVSAALSYRFAPQVTKVLSPTQASAITETIGGLLTVPLALIFCPIHFGSSEIVGWGYVAIHAVLFYAIAVPLLYASLHGIDGWLSSALRAAGPLIAFPIAWIGFGEKLGPVQILGAAVVLITSARISRAEKKVIIESPEMIIEAPRS